MIYANTDILILGGGIGGCSTAHSLRKNGFKGKITIIEQNDRIGGEARSGEWNGLPTEHCWRIYGPGYSTLFDMMKQIPLIENHNKSVYDNLVNLEPYLVAPQNNPAFYFQKSSFIELLKYAKKATKRLTYSQIFDLSDKLLYLSTSSTERLKSELSQTSWKNYINPPTPEAMDYFVRAIGPFYGVDLYKASASSVWEVTEDTAGPDYLDNLALRVMNGPTNEAWFRHWYDFLHNHLNVEILTQNQVIKVESNHSIIQRIYTQDLKTGQYKVWSAQWYVLALPLQVVSKFFNDQKLHQLAVLGKQYMIGLQIYFSEKLTFEFPNVGIYLPQSPWQLIIEPQGSIWTDQNNKPYKDIWSIGICDPKAHGWLYKKPFLKCTRSQVEEEVWYQITHTPSFISQIKTESNRSVTELQPMAIHLWDSYQWSDQMQQLVTTEEKTSPNAGTLYLRPQTQYLNNALFATSFTQNSREMILMDAAAEAGVNASRVISANYQLNNIPPIVPRERLYGGLLFGLLRLIDKILFSCHLRHLSIIFFGLTWPLVIIYFLIIIYLFYYLISKIFKI